MPKKPDTRTELEQARDYVHSKLIGVYSFITRAELGRYTRNITPYMRTLALHQLVDVEQIVEVREERPASGKGPTQRSYRLGEYDEEILRLAADAPVSRDES